MFGRNVLRDTQNKLGPDPLIQLAEEIAYTHHEKWDGSGYPRGLKQHEIPLSGRLMALADVYDALISKRIYKKFKLAPSSQRNHNEGLRKSFWTPI